MNDLADDPGPSDATESEALQNDFIRARTAALDDGLFKLTGGEAVAAAPGAGRCLSDLRNSLVDSAANPSQRAMVASDLDAHMDVARNDIARHVASETKTWDRAVRAERVRLLRDRARRDYDDPARLALYADAAATAGAESEAARSSVWRAGIESALAKRAHGGALDLIDRAREHLTPHDAAVLAPQMALAAQQQTGQDYVEGLLPQPMPATPSETDRAYRQALQANAQAWSDDPAQLATNKHLLDVRFGTHQRELQQAKTGRDQALADWLNRTDADGNKQTERPPPALWTRFDPADHHKIDAQLAANALEETVPEAPTGSQTFTIDIEASRRALQQMQPEQDLPAEEERAGGGQGETATEPAPGSPTYQKAEAEARRLQPEQEQPEQEQPEQEQPEQEQPEQERQEHEEPQEHKEQQEPDARSGGRRFVDGITDNAATTWEGLKVAGSAAIEGAVQAASDLWNKPVETLEAANARINPALIVGIPAAKIARAFAADPRGAAERGLRHAAETGSAVWHGIADPYEEAYRKGGLAQAAGHGTFDVARLALEAALTKGAVSAAATAKTLASLTTVAKATARGKKVSSEIPTIRGFLPVNWEYAGKQHPSGVWFAKGPHPDRRR